MKIVPLCMQTAQHLNSTIPNHPNSPQISKYVSTAWPKQSMKYMYRYTRTRTHVRIQNDELVQEILDIDWFGNRDNM